jgi:hypothetical protein
MNKAVVTILFFVVWFAVGMKSIPEAFSFPVFISPLPLLPDRMNTNA